MSKKFVVGNWKMNLLRREAENLVKEVLSKTGKYFDKCNVVVVPPYTSLETVYETLKNSYLELGAQDVFWEKFGAYTGEISVDMLKDVGCEWVIIGHSERRHLLNESDEEIKRKVKYSVDNGLSVILCVGETQDQRNNNLTFDVIKNQLESALTTDLNNKLTKIVIAYEPVWAIGTGNVAKTGDIIKVHIEIKKILSGLFKNDGNNISLLYGGSVTPENIKDIIISEYVDGALVGGASLDANKFTEIIEIVGA